MVQIKMVIKNIFQKVFNRYRTWADKRFLKTRGFDTWKEYNRHYDPDYNLAATTVKEYYHGYPHFYYFKNYNHEVYDWDVYKDGVYVLNLWCEENCQSKFRLDFLRIHYQTAIGINNDYFETEMHISDAFGRDYIFAAFKDEQDYIWFKTRWA